MQYINMRTDHIKPRKLPVIRWVLPPDPADYQPSPPPDMENFHGICVTIDRVKFCEFMEECKNKEEKNNGSS